MNRKSFFAGLITGLVIALFLGSCALCAHILLGGSKAEAVVQREIEEKKTAKEKTTKENEEISEKIDNTEFSNEGYILENPEVTRKLMEIEDTIDNNYVESVSDSTLEEGIYDGIMEALGDPYAAYYTKEELEELMNSTEGIYYGIGAYLQKNQTTLYPQITGIIANSPAEESQLRVDDYIVEVDGKDIYDMELSDAVALIKGPEGTDVTLTVVRPSDGKEFEEVITRRKVESPTVNYEISDDGIAYIQITEFDVVTVDQFAEAINEVKRQNMKGLILDLRGNPGGSVGAVVEIARMMLPEGLVVYTEDKDGKRYEYKCDGKYELDVPMVVLIDGGSASSAEILAGAIKDYGIATLIGTTTYGKGIVQRVVDLKDGSAVKLTVSHYYTPKGNDIHKLGIEPDEEVKFDAEAYYAEDSVDNQKERAYEILREEIK